MGGNGMVQITDMQVVGRAAAGRMREWKLERKVGEKNHKWSSILTAMANKYAHCAENSDSGNKTW